MGSGVYAWEFERAEHAVEVKVEGPLTFNDPELMVEAALDGLGVAYVFEERVRPLVAAGRLVRLLADWTPTFPGFFLYHPSRRQPPPALAALVEALRRHRWHAARGQLEAKQDVAQYRPGDDAWR